MVTQQYMMESYMAHITTAVLLAVSTVSVLCRDDTTVWNKERSPMKVGSDPYIPSWIPNVDHCSLPGSKQCSNEKSTQPGVIININNFFCLTESQEINLNPIKSHPQVRTAEPIIEHLPMNRGTQCGELFKPEQSNDSKNAAHRGMIDEYLNSNNVHLKQDLEGLIRRVVERVLENPQILAKKDKTNYESSSQLKNIFCYTGGLDTTASSSVNGCEDRKLNWPLPSKTPGSNHDWAPTLQVFIDGKRVNESQSHQNTQKYKPSSNYNEATDTFKESDYTGIGKKTTTCEPEEDSNCSSDGVIFHGGFELTSDQLEQIFEEITNKPDEMKLIVPGGVTGPLFGYFQQVETAGQELALQHGVCLLSNGFFVPIKPMLSLLQLHGWLSSLISTLNSKTFRLLHVSKWKDMKGVLGILQCLIKSGKVMVVLPSNLKLVFSQFEKQGHHIPNPLLKELKVELLGFSIPLIIFKNSLNELCETVNHEYLKTHYQSQHPIH